MKLKHIIFLLLFFITSSHTHAQYYETGQDPSSLKWAQINSEHFKVIFPDSYLEQAVQFTNELEKSFLKLNTVYPVKKIKLPVIIHNYSIVSNGFVSWAPKRMEIYPLPDQDNIPMDQMEQFALHELNHAMQIQSLNQGFSKGLSYLLGEQATGALTAYAPLWFLEGDAVYSETKFSASGRGNNPSFNKRIKALTLENNYMYKYDKMLSGSFKNYTPDHYQFGYQLVAWSKQNFPSVMWPNTLKYIAQNPFSINPVNISLKKEEKLTKKKIFYQAFDSLKLYWQKEDLNNKSVQYSPINPPKKGEYVNYYSPISIGIDSIIAIKTSLYNPPEFVLITRSGEVEKNIYSPGSIYPYFFSFNNGKLVWAETQPDPRWENRGYSAIKILDMKHNKTTQLTKKSRLMAPSISPDGKFVAAAESTPEYQNNLVIIDAKTGKWLQTIPTPDNVFPQRPQWSDDGSSITIVYLATEGEGIMVYENRSGLWKTLISASGNDLQCAFLRNDSLFYVSSLSGIDNIYIQRDNTITRLTSSRFGAYDLNLNNSSLLFTDYTSTGYKICTTKLNYQNVIVTDSDKPLLRPVGDIGNGTGPLSAGDYQEYKPEPFNKLKNLLHFHSWMPFYADIENIQSDPLSIKPGATILSQNLLGTLTSSIGYEYNNKNHFLHTKVEWKGWYPFIQTDISLGGDPEILSGSRFFPMQQRSHLGQNITTDIILPLRFSHSKFSQQLRPSLSVSYHNKYIFLPETRTYDYGQFRLTGRVYFANYGRSAIRDIFPKFGQVIDYSYSFTPFDNNIYGTVNSLKTAFFFPGPFRNHGIRLRFETDIQKPEMYLQFNRASFPRGYKNIISEKLQFYSADYAIPLFYPDFNVGSLIFIKRFRTNLFYDYAEGKGNSHLDIGVHHNYKETFSSLGFDFLSDFYLLRIPFMISAGVQTSYMTVTKTVNFNILFNIDVFGLQFNRLEL